MSTFVGNSDGAVAGLCPAPPPPPPPPPVPGQVPAMRINTAEAPTIKRPQMASNDAYEPPAAIQNAMLTKDKKPFTYTPGMGGKLDLSQIRSPRMARRVAKNANDEGIEGPPKSALEPKPTPAPNSGANLFVQPQVAIPVFPTNVPVQPLANRTPSTPPTPPTPPANKIQPSTPKKQPESPKALAKVETKVTPSITIQPNTPESPSTPTQVTLTKAPTPWLQNKNKPQEELPEWAKRPSASKQSSSSPESPTSPPIYASSTQQSQQQQPQWQQAQPRQQNVQQRPLSQPPQQVPMQQSPVQVQQQPQPYYQQPQPPFNQQQKQRPFSSPAAAQQTNSREERVIPIHIEDRPSVFDVKPEAGHHQFKQPTTHHQQRWGQPSPVQNQPHNQANQVQQSPPPQQSTGGAFIIPIMIEGNDKKPAAAANSNAVYSQPVVRNNVAVGVENQTPKVTSQRVIPVQMQQSDSGPVQSRSFRVLQKITDTDMPNDIDTEQMRKLQLTDDDRTLMNKFKEQVDNDSSLHHEEDPRYRGAAIPSRAFRFLQTMTDSGDHSVMNNAMPRPPSAINKRQNRNSKTFEETQANLPPSEQQVPEPKKYMGSAIPSRSFRILQAMTAPESVATQENRQADYHCQTETNVPGNQQGVFLPSCPPPFWSPDSGWWGYYPLPYPGASNDSYPYHPDNTAYIYFPIYNQTYPGYRNDPANEKNVYQAAYPQYLPVPVPVSVQNSSICGYACGQVGGAVIVPKIDPANVANHSNVTSIANAASNSVQGVANIPNIRSVSNIAHTSNISNIPSIVNGTESGPSSAATFENEILKEDDERNDRPEWERGSSVSRTASNNSKDSDCTTAMNITDEEEIPEEMVPPKIANQEPEGCNQLEAKTRTGGSLNVAVPNYTYIDTSDSSSDSTDSECSQSDNESVTESSEKSSSDHSEDSTSDSEEDDDDSDSYLAYSTGLNPLQSGKTETDTERCPASKGEEQKSEASCKNDSYREPDAEEQNERGVERSGGNIFPHTLSVIYEDVERSDSASPRPPEVKSKKDWNETPFEATDDPPDDSDAPTVSVSLPLRFKFSVSENNEDVTTVIVGDSTIKPERGYNVEESGNLKGVQEKSRSLEKVANDVSADFLVKNDNTVDFTIKKEGCSGKSKGKSQAKSSSDERVKEGTVREETNKGKESEEVVPHVNFTLRKIPTRFSKINCGETVETEFTIKRRSSIKREEERTNKVQEERVKIQEGKARGQEDRKKVGDQRTKIENKTKMQEDKQNVQADRIKVSEDQTVSQEDRTKAQEDRKKVQEEKAKDVSAKNVDESLNKGSSSKEGAPCIKETRETGPATRDFNRNILKPEVIVSDCNWTGDTAKESFDGFENAISKAEQHNASRENDDVSRKIKQEEDNIEEKTGKESKHLLSVQNSREETDDEDSGVTSDMSRMISEVDTDSECTSSRNMRKYQRTQTHSRLFRLLNDDSILPNVTEKSSASPMTREYLSLPLKNNTFNYDENYCSNYSSGLTSPEYSPSCEQSWRRLHEVEGSKVQEQNGDLRQGFNPLARQDRISYKEDPYYQAWKSPKSPVPLDNDVVPSLAFKVLESRRPLWSYKVNVLCPRIKSTKSVPQTLQTSKESNDSSVSSCETPSPLHTNLRNGNC